VFLGVDTHALDDKGRLVMPSKYRASLTDGCVVVPGRLRQLVVYTVDAFMVRAREYRERPRTIENERFERIFFGMADQQTLDKSGRLLLRPELRDLASLEPGGSVVIMGLEDHIELWTPTAFERQRQLSSDAYYHKDEEDVPVAS